MTEPAASPYLPDGRQWAWDSTSLGLALDCPRKYYYAQIMGWRSRGDNVHLTFGTLFHAALEHYDHFRAAGAIHAEAMHTVVRETLEATWTAGAPWTPDHSAKTRRNLIRSIIWYLEQFEDDPCETVILADGRPAVELSFSFELTDEIMLCGHLDRLVSYQRSYYVQDRKTTGSTIGGYFFDRFNPDTQMSLYTFAGQVIWQVPVKGVMIDGAQIAVGFTRFARGFTFRTPAQIAEWPQTALYHIRQTWAAAEAGYPMNESACSKYGECQFRRICSKDPSVRQHFLETDFEQRPWNPLEKR